MRFIAPQSAAVVLLLAATLSAASIVVTSVHADCPAGTCTTVVALRLASGGPHTADVTHFNITAAATSVADTDVRLTFSVAIATTAIVSSPAPAATAAPFCNAHEELVPGADNCAGGRFISPACTPPARAAICCLGGSAAKPTAGQHCLRLNCTRRYRRRALRAELAVTAQLSSVRAEVITSAAARCDLPGVTLTHPAASVGATTAACSGSEATASLFTSLRLVGVGTGSQLAAAAVDVARMTAIVRVDDPAVAGASGGVAWGGALAVPANADTSRLGITPADWSFAARGSGAAFCARQRHHFTATRFPGRPAADTDAQRADQLNGLPQLAAALSAQLRVAAWFEAGAALVGNVSWAAPSGAAYELQLSVTHPA
jgi:hypothetical protein